MNKAICNKCYGTGAFKDREGIPFTHCSAPQGTTCDNCETRTTSINLVQ